MRLILLASVGSMAVLLAGCVSHPPGMDLYVTSFPESANLVCKFDNGWKSLGRTPAEAHADFNQQELAQGYADFPCYVQWVSGKKVTLEMTRFPVHLDKRLQYTFHVSRPKGGDLQMDVAYDSQMKQTNATLNAARYQANATVNAARYQADAAVEAARIVSRPRPTVTQQTYSAPTPMTTRCSRDWAGNVTCTTY